MIILWNDLNKTWFQSLSSVTVHKWRFSCLAIRNRSYSPLEEFQLNISSNPWTETFVSALWLIGDWSGKKIEILTLSDPHTYAGGNRWSALLVAFSTTVACDTRHTVFTGALACGLVTGFARGPHRMAITGCEEQKKRDKRKAHTNSTYIQKAQINYKSSFKGPSLGK